MVKLLFDLDATLTRVETLPLIARHFGLERDLDRMTVDTVHGRIPFAKSLTSRVAMLGDLPVDEVADLLGTVPVHERIRDLIREQAARCRIVTGNLDCWIGPLVRSFDCDVSSSLATVVDNRIRSLDAICDKAAVVQACRAEGAYVVFVGDGHNDLEAMRAANLAVAASLVRPVPEAVRRAADHEARSEDALEGLLRDILQRPCQRGEAARP